MRRWLFAAAVGLPSGCGIALSCTEIGCLSSVSIDVADADPADHDFDVVVTVGADVVGCSGTFDPENGLVCGDVELIPSADGYQLLVLVVEEEDVSVSITRDGTEVFDGPVAIAWGEPSFPNGEACGPRCVNGTGAVEVP